MEQWAVTIDDRLRRTPCGVCELKFLPMFPRHTLRGRTPCGVCELKLCVTQQADPFSQRRTPCGVCELKSGIEVFFTIGTTVALRVGCVS